MTNPAFPWPIDADINEFDLMVESLADGRYVISPSSTVEYLAYLITRLKLAEGKRDEAVNLFERITTDLVGYRFSDDGEYSNPEVINIFNEAEDFVRRIKDKVIS